MNDSSINPEILSKIEKLNKLALQRGQTLAQMALAWIYAKDGITSVLIGASKPSQILDNIGMLKNTRFTKEELDLIDNIVL